jgi:hypothetical protein
MIIGGKKGRQRLNRGVSRAQISELKACAKSNGCWHGGHGGSFELNPAKAGYTDSCWSVVSRAEEPQSTEGDRDRCESRPYRRALGWMPRIS